MLQRRQAVAGGGFRFGHGRASAPRAWPPQGPFGLSVPMSPSPSGTDRTPVLAGRGGRGPGRVRPFRRRRTALRAPVRQGVRAAAPLHPSPAGGPAPSVACRAAPALEAHTHDWQHNFQLGTRIIPRQGSQKFAAPPAPVSPVSPYSPSAPFPASHPANSCARQAGGFAVPDPKGFECRRGEAAAMVRVATTTETPHGLRCL